MMNFEIVCLQGRLARVSFTSFRIMVQGAKSLCLAVSFLGCPVENLQWHNPVILDLAARQHLRSLNLQGLSCLLELKLFCCHDLKEIVFSCSSTQGTEDSHEASTSTSGCMTGLQAVILDTFEILEAHSISKPVLEPAIFFHYLLQQHSVSKPYWVFVNPQEPRLSLRSANIDNLSEEALTSYASALENRIELMVSDIATMTNLTDLNLDGYCLPFTFEVDFSRFNNLTIKSCILEHPWFWQHRIFDPWCGVVEIGGAQSDGLDGASPAARLESDAQLKKTLCEPLC